MNYLEMTEQEKFQMQRLMLHRYASEATMEGLSDGECREWMEYELELLEQSEKFEECALLRDTIKIWDDLND